jgi:hypothetical protein
VADRRNRKKITVACDATAAFLLAAIPAVTALHQLTLAQVRCLGLPMSGAMDCDDA